MPTRLTLLAILFGAPLLLLGSLTNSWWSTDSGPVSAHVGLTKLKVCAGAINCQSVSFDVFDASMEQNSVNGTAVDGNGNVVEVGKSYAWAGSAVFWLSILFAIVAIVFYKTASDDDPWKPAAAAGLAILGIAAVLAILFVVKKPNMLLRTYPASFGYSFYAFFAGCLAAGFGIAAETFQSGYRETAFAGQPSARAPARQTRTSTPTPNVDKPCQSCGGAPVFREDVGCQVCSKCGVLI